MGDARQISFLSFSRSRSANKCVILIRNSSILDFKTYGIYPLQIREHYQSPVRDSTLCSLCGISRVRSSPPPPPPPTTSTSVSHLCQHAHNYPQLTPNIPFDKHTHNIPSRSPSTSIYPPHPTSTSCVSVSSSCRYQLPNK